MTIDSARGALDPAILAAMDHDAFNELIRNSIGTKTDPAIWDVLTHRLVIARTKGCLSALHQDVLNQLSTANSELEDMRADCFRRGDEGKQQFYDAKSAQAEWRQRTAGFRRLLERRMALVRSRSHALAAAKPPNPPGFAKSARIHNRDALEKLARAVVEHRRAVTSGDGDEGDDETLWDCLTSITAMAGQRGAMPLAEWLEFLDDMREDEEG